MIVRPWEEGDTERLVIQQSQEYMADILGDLDIEPLTIRGMAWVAEVDEGIIAIAGLAPQWKDRAVAWALISPAAGRHFLKIHREVRKFLTKAPFRRIEATVDVGFQPGHRWMKMLGFEPEGYLKAFRPDGGDQIMYARIRW